MLTKFNLALRFILEMVVLLTAAYWGWTLYTGWQGVVIAFLLPVLLASIWGIFAVRDDPSRSGKTVINTPGWLRLIIELMFFCTGAVILYLSKNINLSILFSSLVVLHYFFSWKRLRWLVKQ